MTVNMKPYDPEHKGEFCFSDRPDFDRILCTDAPGDCPIKVLTKGGGIVHCDATGLSRSVGVRLMCVISKREARVIVFDENGYWTDSTRMPGHERPNSTFREIMPDDISQEKARGVVEAAREVVSLWKVGTVSRIDDLRAALGDDA